MTPFIVRIKMLFDGRVHVKHIKSRMEQCLLISFTTVFSLSIYRIFFGAFKSRFYYLFLLNVGWFDASMFKMKQKKLFHFSNFLFTFGI